MANVYSSEVKVTDPISINNFPATQPVSGTVSVDNFPPVSGTVSVSNFPANQPVTVTNTVNVTTAMSSSATVAQVAMVNNVNNTILAANANRKSAVIFLPSQPMNIKLGATASATSFTYRITANNTILTINGYTGQIDGFGNNMTVNVTELV